jgi:hypothetical protein
MAHAWHYIAFACSARNYELVRRDRLTKPWIQFACLFFSLAAVIARAGDDVDYVRDIKPILQARCYACHGVLKQEGNLRIDSVALMLKGGDSGPIIESANIQGSVLIDRVSDPDESTRMPQEGAALKREEIDLLTRWIEQGAKSPADDAPEPDPREHWSFKPLVRKEPPVGSESHARIRNEIDAFVSAGYAKHGLQPVAEADKPTLLRRVYLDLIGLPPSRDELHSFLADTSPAAYEKVVDRLLASPQYGERWGRHWMDVWRYSDWYGRRNASDVINSYPMIWRWRDWIVRSLNEDRGYDRMITEMLAADEVEPENDDNVVATGFLVRNCFRWNYNQWMKDNVEHTAKAFLGLTINCAHCHDHKYDPITQEEYFAFRAFFEPLELRQDRVAGSPDPGPYKKYVYLEKLSPIQGGLIRVFDEKLDAQTRMYARGDERNVMEDKPPVGPRVPAILGVAEQIHPIDLPPVASYPGLKPFIAKEELAKAQATIENAERNLATAKAKLATDEPALVADLKAAELRVATLEAGKNVDAKSQALVGKQSLFLEATKGRRALSNNLSQLGAVKVGTSLSFQLLLLADKHAGLQLALNTSTGATGALIAFEQGRIVTYAPGTFTVTEIGQYDLANGHKRVGVTAVLDPPKDEIRFTIRDLDTNIELCADKAGALHGWNSIRHREQGLILDARPGTVVAFDEIAFTQPGEKAVIHFDFEPSRYPRSEDAVGRHGWAALPFCVAPATSFVAEHASPSASLASAKRKQAAAERRLDALRLRVPVAETALVAAKADKSSLQARIAAGNAKFLKTEDAHGIAQHASHAERAAAHANALAQEQVAELALAEIEGKTATNADKSAARTNCEQAHEAVVAAAEALSRNSDTFTLITPHYPSQSSGRRSALALAITDHDNPLTARVAVNHIWMRHFGHPLVESVFDFGRNGKQPTNLELLNWLAVEFRDSNWSMKHLHRLIVTSTTYRLSSVSPANSDNVKLDPDDQYLWKFLRQRMQAEVVRDSILRTAGQLDLTLGGPEIEQAAADKTHRRSIYISHHGESRAAILETFNAPSPTDCYRRLETVIPQQALAIANSELTREASHEVARVLWQKVLAASPPASDPDVAFVDAAFEQLLTRQPQSAERDAALELIKKQAEIYRSVINGRRVVSGAPATSEDIDPQLRARASLVHALYSHHDFISVR